MMSLATSNNLLPLDSSVALYRGVTVVVHKVNKTELHLTRNDLIELVNVSRHTVVLCSA